MLQKEQKIMAFLIGKLKQSQGFQFIYYSKTTIGKKINIHQLKSLMILMQSNSKIQSFTVLGLNLC